MGPILIGNPASRFCLANIEIVRNVVFKEKGSTIISFNTEVTVSVMCLYERFGGAHNPQVALG